MLCRWYVRDVAILGWDDLSEIQRKEQKRGCKKNVSGGYNFREAPGVEGRDREGAGE
jgi:hypothetical protein